MKKSVLLLAFTLMFSLNSFQQTTEFLNGKLIVQLANNNDFINLADTLDFKSIFLSEINGLEDIATEIHISKVARSVKLAKKSNQMLKGFYTIEFDTAQNLNYAINLLDSLNCFISIDKIGFYTINYTPNDSLYLQNLQWYLNKIELDSALSYSVGSPSIKIAVIDDAILIRHKDLQLNIAVNQNELDSTISDANNNGIIDVSDLFLHYNQSDINDLWQTSLFDSLDNDSNGFVDDIFGWDFNLNCNNPNPALFPVEENNHGTAVAGLVSAVTNNAIGVASIGSGCSVLPLKTYAAIGANAETIANALAYAFDENADIISISMGGPQNAMVDSILSVIHENGVFLVASAGNDSVNLAGYPANNEYSIAVAALDSTDHKRFDSNYGLDIDICAPADQMVTLWKYGDDFYAYKYDFGATSGAAPLVSGLLGLMKSYFPYYNYETIKYCLLSAADSLPNETLFMQNMLGVGRINARRSMQCLKELDLIANFELATGFYCDGMDFQAIDQSVGLISEWHWSGSPGVIFSNDTIPDPIITLNTNDTAFSISLEISNDTLSGSTGFDIMTKNFIIGGEPLLISPSVDTICNLEVANAIINLGNLPFPSIIYFHNDSSTFLDTLVESISSIELPYNPSSTSIFYLDSIQTLTNCIISFQDTLEIISSECECIPRYNNNWMINNIVMLNHEPNTSNTNSNTTIAPLLLNNRDYSVASDAKGDLLFFTDGVSIFDRNYTLMQNGAGLNGSTEALQNAIILPDPNSPNRYYVFTIKNQYYDSTGLFFHIVDFNSSTNGEVVSKNNILQCPKSVSNRMTWVNDGSDSNAYWIITHSHYEDFYYAFRFSSSGFSGPIISKTGHYCILNNNIVGTIKPNKQGTLLATTFFNLYFDDYLELATFNNITGEIAVLTSVQKEDVIYSEFSPTSNYLFCVKQGQAPGEKINRYNISSSSPYLSNLQYVGQENGMYRNIQIDPRGKSIIARNILNDYLEAIINPDDSLPIVATLSNFLVGSSPYGSKPFPQPIPISKPIVEIQLVVDTGCFCQNSITCNVIGGVNPLQYTWNDINNQTLQTATSLCPDFYQVVISDAIKCSYIDSTFIPDKTPKILSIDTIQPCVGLSNGIIVLHMDTVGGPFSFEWSNGITTKDIYGLTAGNYTVTVYNFDQSCSINQAISLSYLPQNISVSSEIINETCPGVCNGAIDLTVSGNQSPYTYDWSNGESTQDIDNLCPGEYWVTISDQYNCPTAFPFRVIEFEQQFNINYTDSICGCYGTANISTTNQSYYYNWTNGSHSDSVSSLCPDSTYFVLVMDTLNNCMFLDTVLINYSQPDLNIQFTSTHGCGCVNDLSVSASTQFGPYYYNWSTSETMQSLSNKCPGHYWVTVTSQEHEFCSSSAYYYLQDTSNYAFSFIPTAPLCEGIVDGNLEVHVYDSTFVGPAYPYVISLFYNSSLAGWQSLQNPGPPYANFDVTSGYYYLSATDNNGCFVDDTIYIKALYNPYYDINSINSTTCEDTCDGEIEFTLFDFSAAPYEFFYGNTSLITSNPNDIITNLCPGVYSDVIVDANGCLIPYEFEILASELFMDADILSLMCSGTGQGSIDITLNSYQAPYTYIWNTSATTQDITFSNYGAYSVTATSLNAPVCEISDTFIIDSTDAMTVNLVPIHPSCPGISNGGIQVNTTGGAIPYQYEWSSGQSTQNITGLDLGTYTVTVTDSNGCTEVKQLELITINFIQVDIDATNPTCVDANNISIPGPLDLTIYGGIQPYSVVLSTGTVSEDISQLYAGSYQFTVTDSIGCIYIDSAFITQPTILVDLDVLGQGCDSTSGQPSNGQISLLVSGGTEPYAYLWSNASTATNLQNLEDFDIYSVTITDQNGCTGLYTTEVLSEQDITLPINWSIWSTYIDLTGQYFDTIFMSQNLVQDIIIMKNDAGYIIWPDYSLYYVSPNIQDGYQIKMKNPRIIHLEGSLLCPEDVSIYINNPWMYVPYLRKTSGNIVDLLAPIAQLYNQNNIMEIAKAGNGNTYWPKYGLNTIGNMIPGQGYQMNFNVTNTSFSYPSNLDSLGTKSLSFEMENYLNQIEQFNFELNTGSSMTLGIPIEAWDVIPEIGSVIKALGKSYQIVGKTVFCGGFTAMNLYGDDISTVSEKEGLKLEEEFHLEVQNPYTKSTEVFQPRKWLRGSQTYSTNKISVAGTKDIPFGSESFIAGLEVYPNPNNGSFTLNASVGRRGAYKIIITSVDGKTISEVLLTLEIGLNTIPMNNPYLAKGVYIVSVTNPLINLKSIILIN